MMPVMLFSPPPPTPPAPHHHGYNDAGYRGSKVYPHTKAHVPLLDRERQLWRQTVEFLQLFLEAGDDVELSSSTSSSGQIFMRVKLVAMVSNMQPRAWVQ